MNLDKLSWYFNRLKAMNFKEIIWRLGQKKIEKKEKNIYENNKVPTIGEVMNEKLVDLLNTFNNRKFYLNKSLKYKTLNENLWLFDKYDYKNLKKQWNYGFDTKNYWPNKFSYDLNYKQNDNIGDARTNWELNRHYQFGILAKNYFISNDNKYLDELIELFYDWNDKNPFLIGISWTSVMEVSIRCYSWIVTLVFLKESGLKNNRILRDLEVGIINMVDYTNKHHSRYSSANNHLIVEMIVVGVAGVLFENRDWYLKAINILDKELVLQNYSDGVNKEHALHYQTFVMEAISLFMLILKRNELQYPSKWNELLAKMSEFISDNMDSNYNVSHLGDSDDGKILDLFGEHMNHYKYVLELTSLLLGKKYLEIQNPHENIRWLFTDDEINNVTEVYNNKKSKCYKEGGYTIMKSEDESENDIVVVVDHAELGFGSIAAHGHADSLSFTMSVNSNRVFIDPGTYIYHIDLHSRNYFRKTINHNTLCIDGKDQSEMLGAFLWGKRANTTLCKYEINEKQEILVARHDGYKPLIHNREFIFNKKDKLIINDEIEGKEFNWVSTLVIDPKVNILQVKDNEAILIVDSNEVIIKVDNGLRIEIEEIWISEIYSNKVKSKALKVRGSNSENLKLKTEITIK